MGLGGIWRRLGASWKRFGQPKAKGRPAAFCVGMPWGVLEASEGGLEGCRGAWVALGASWKRFGNPNAKGRTAAFCSGVAWSLGGLGASWRRLGPSWQSQCQAQPMSGTARHSRAVPGWLCPNCAWLCLAMPGCAWRCLAVPSARLDAKSVFAPPLLRNGGA